ncbi:hypothetical protein ACN42_g629 [Penicillium freii]|uniref:Carrier domain-containing protein n=1 Tax=Penicillium freii TaxID=48697 RepID=A0A124GT63_PENFR|nr:hypothetical protein ACN42_g629 [Penicillium freii]
MEIHPSIFPVLNGEGESSDTSFNVIRLPLNKNLVAERQGNDQPSLSHFVKQAWALLVSRYIDSQIVSFGVLEDKEDVSPPRLCQDVHCQTEICMETWETSDASSGCLSKMARKLETEPWPQPELAGKASPMFDTCVSIKSQSYLEDIDVSLALSQDCKLLVTLERGHPAVNLALWYSSRHVSSNFAHCILDTLMHIFQSLQQSLSSHVSRLSFLGPHAKNLIADWNAPKLLGRPRTCIHLLILDHCQTHPNDEAVCAWDGSMTYAELDRASAPLALQLTSSGVRPETIVPLLFEKSMWTIVAILGVLRAGGAFTLIDPSQPSTRLAEICTTVQASIMIASKSLDEKARSLGCAVVLLPSALSSDESSLGYAAVTSPANAENAAYVAFTSGSMGKPKAIVIEHGSFCANASAQNEAQNLNRRSRAFQFASYAFDSSILEMLMTLIAGGCVCIPSDAQRVNELASTINALRANWLELTPSVVRILSPASVPTVQSLLLVGEPLSQENIATWAGKVQLINAYGPAECSVVSTIQPCVNASDPLNIGRSHSGHCWIVNPRNHDQLQPMGAAGELFISGPLVGRGYLNCPDQQGYIQAPSWAAEYGVSQTERFYRTGDIVSCNIDDGSLRYIGRKDRQIKLHGQRIELQEVEHHAQQYRDGLVAVADVVLPGGDPSGAVLTLFVAPETHTLGSNHDQKDLMAQIDDDFRALWQGMQEFLRERLPSFMVPNKFIPMHRFPLSHTGKLDRKTLVNLASQINSYSSSPSFSEQLPPTPDEMNEEEMSMIAKGRCEIEKILRTLFAGVVGIPRSQVSSGSDFFSLGGTSLRAIELVARARSQDLAITATDVIMLKTPARIASVATRCDELPSISPFTLLSNACLQLVERTTEQLGREGIKVEDMYPCTPLQAGMMSLSVKIPGSLVGTFVFSLRSTIDLDRFKLAWEHVVSTNPILRTRIMKFEREIIQVVTTEKVQWADSYPTSEFCASMTLGNPLLRLAVVDRSFVMTMHHAIFDGWSYSQIMEEMEAAYNARPSPPQYSFKSVISYISQINAQQAQSFWAAEFAGLCEGPAFPLQPTGLPSASRLPQLRRRTVPFRASDHDWALPFKVQIAWAMVIASHSSTNDVVFGLTVSGRTAPIDGLDRITGPTIATIPCRVHIRPDKSLQETLIQLHDKEIARVPFEHTGLARIAESSPEATVACGFQSLLTVRLRSAAQSPTAIMVDAPDNADEEQKFGTYPLTMTVQLHNDSLQLNALFNGATLAIDRIELILESFTSALNAVLRLPIETPLGDLMAHSDIDTQQLKVWNKRDVPAPRDCIHEIIRAHCINRPNSDAICAWDGCFTYQELFQNAQSVAAYVQAQGARPEVMVGICMERSRWFPVAILGVLMSGAAIVLLEPNFPVARLQSICHDVDVHILICSPCLHEKCSELGDATILTLAEETVADLDFTSYRISSVNPQNAAYVAFTSGSTGVPKGVIIEHGMLSLVFYGHAETMCLSQASRGLFFASVAFDISIGENIFVLAAGGCVCIPSEAQRMSDLVGVISDMKVNWALLTPTVGRTLDPSKIPSLKTLVLAGEPMSRADIAMWTPSVQLRNAYGPAECSILTTTADCMAEGYTGSNVGFPPNASCWIVDPDNHDKLQPVGNVGELVIGGSIVGRGYANRPDETRAAFIHGPAWAVDFPFLQYHRFYKTGDLAFQKPDGSLWIVGRKDNQVKLNGQRIELREIEHCAESYQDGVTAIASLVNLRNFNGGARIFLFTCATESVDCRVDKGKTSPSGADTSSSSLFVSATDRDPAHLKGLMDHIRERLPHFMVPSTIVPLSYLPLTPSGKTNRKYLREQAQQMTRETVDGYNLSSSAPKREPVTTEEAVVRRAFARALSVDNELIGIDDNFFTLGGDSISAMRLLNLCRKENMSLTMTEFLEYNTIALFCRNSHLVKPRQTPTDPVNAPVEKANGQNNEYFNTELNGETKKQLSLETNATPSIKLTHGQWEKLYTLLNLNSVSMIEDVYPCSDAHAGILEVYTPEYRGNLTFGIQSSEVICPAQVISAWLQVVQLHTALRTVIVQDPTFDPPVIQVLMKKATPAVLVLRPSDSIIQDLKSLPPCSWNSSAAHRLVVGQNLRGKVFVKLETGRALIDAMSVSILLTELRMALGGCLPLHTGSTYSQYLFYLQRQSRDQTHDYWQKSLSRARPSNLFRNPDSKPNPDSLLTNRESRCQDGLLPKEYLDRFQAFWRSYQLTATNIFQLAWGLVLRHYIGSTDVCFGGIVSGRDVPLEQIWQMVGPFFNILPCSMTLDPQKTVLQILRQNQQSIQQRNTHQHCSVPEAVRRAGLDVQGEKQLFNTVLTVQPEFESEDSSTDIKFNIIDLDDATEYDMCVAVVFSDRQINVELRYWTSTFTDALAAEILNRFFRAVVQILEHAEDSIAIIKL